MKDHNLLSKKIEDYIDKLLGSGQYHIGDRLLPERELAQLFNASNKPVRAAMQKYIDRGILERVHGSGTFVRELLKRQLTDRIAVVHCHSREGFFNSPFYAAIMGGIEKEAQANKKNLLIRSLMRDPDEDPVNAFRELAGEVDGFIAVDLTPEIYDRIRDMLPGLNRPLVVLNFEGDDLGVDSIVTDSPGNTHAAVQYLVNQGHRKIELWSMTHGVEMHPNFLIRQQVFKDVLAANGIPVTDTSVRFFKVRPGYIDVREAVRSVFPEGLEAARAELPTAVFCPGSYILPSLMYPAMRQAGLSIPDDISVIGYDDDRQIRNLTPAPTAMETGIDLMGSLGIRRLQEKLEERGRGEDIRYRITLPGSIRVRGSVKQIDS